MEILLDIKNSVLSEGIVFFGIVSMFLFCIISRNLSKNFLFWFNLVILSLALFVLFKADFSFNNYVFDGVIALNSFTLFFKKLILIGAIFTIFLSDKFLSSQKEYRGEFYILLLCSVLASMLLCCSNNFLMLYIALELLGVSGYLMCGFSFKDKFASEAMLKYFISGSVASAVLLYGISIVYGLSASLQFEIVSQKFVSTDYAAVLSGILILSGLCFKIAAVPFYNWASDVYKGASLPVSAFLSVVPKLAAFGILIRLLSVVYNQVWILYPFIAVLAVLTMSVGNLLALKETNMRKFMAYSSIAQGGYVLAVVALGSALSISAALFYLVTYIFMNFCAWGALSLISENRELSISDLKGAVYKNPFASVCLILAMVSLAGLPFSVGFFSKFYMFQSIAFAGFVLLPFLFIILLNVLVSFYYYFDVIKNAVSLNALSKEGESNTKIKIATLFCAIFILISGFLSFWFIDISQEVSMEQMSSVLNLKD